MPDDGVSTGGFLDADGVWREAERDLAWAAGRAAIFLDRDGVIVEETGYLHRVEDVALIAGTAEFIAEANRRSVPVVVASNQAGIGRGYFHWADFHAVQTEMKRLLGTAGAHVDLTLACPHYPDHPDRKPCPGMLRKAGAMAGLELERAWLIGDKVSDLEAAQAAGLAGGVLVLTGHGVEHREAARQLAFPVTVVGSIGEARWVLDKLMRRADGEGLAER
jgi:D-glycero-D-manno-heptose 1,7-bisphosphate phosphatase